MPHLRIFKHIKALLSIDLITYCILLFSFHIRNVNVLSVLPPVKAMPSHTRLSAADDRQQNTLFYSSRKVLCTTNQDTLFYWLCTQVLLFRLFSAVRFLCSLPMFMTLIRISTDVSYHLQDLYSACCYPLIIKYLSHFPRLLMLGILISS